MFGTRIYKRDRIWDALKAVCRYPATLVVAKEGYGKTTAVRSFLQAQGGNVLWMSALDSLGDLERFWEQFLTLLERRSSKIAVHLLEQRYLRNYEKVIRMLAAVVDRSGKGPFYFVVDDFHMVMQHSVVSDILMLLMEAKIPNLHVVLLADRWPPKEIRSMFEGDNPKGLLLDPDLFVLLIEEAKAYMEVTFGDIKGGTLRKMMMQAKGRVLTLHLLGYAYRNQHVLYLGEMEMNELLDKCMWQNQTPVCKELLYEISCFPFFGVEQLRSFTSFPQALDLFYELSQDNPLIVYHPVEQTYSLHPVLFRFLHEEVQGREKCCKAVYSAKGEYHFRNGEIMESLDCFYRADDLHVFFEKVRLTGKLDLGYLDISRKEEIYLSLGEETILRYPVVMLQFALEFFLHDAPTTIEHGLDIIELLEVYFSERREDVFLRKRVLGEIEIVRGLFLERALTAKIRCMNKAKEYFAGDSSWIIFRNSPFSQGVPSLLYACYYKGENLRDTIELAKAEFPLAVLGGCGRGAREILQAELALETGNFTRAQMYADQAKLEAMMANQIDMVLLAQFVSVRANFMRGETVKAGKLYREVGDWFRNLQPILNKESRLVLGTMMDMLIGYAASSVRKTDSVAEWLVEEDLSQATMMRSGLGYYYIVYGKIAVAKRLWKELDRITREYRIYLEQNGYQLGIIHNSIHMSIAARRLESTERGVIHLKYAIDIAVGDGIVMPFAENIMEIGEMLMVILEKVMQESSEEAKAYCGFIQTIQQLGSTYETLRGGAVYQSYSAREVEVLSLFVQGLSNAQISSRLLLADGELEVELAVIFGKLGAHNREEALMLAVESGYCNFV